MDNAQFIWKRYWCPRGASVPLDDDGFLLSPTAKFARWIMPDVKPLSEISSVPCLVLLGEPGLGKSTELRAASTDSETHFVDLGKFTTDSHLIREVFENERLQSGAAGRRS